MPKSKFGISCACLGIAIGGAMLIGIAVFLIFSGGNMGLELGGSTIQCENIPEPQLRILTKASQQWQVRIELLAAVAETESSFITGDINRNWNGYRNKESAVFGPFQFAQQTFDGHVKAIIGSGKEADAGGENYQTDQTGIPDGKISIYSLWDSAWIAAYKLAMGGAGGNADPNTTEGLKNITKSLAFYGDADKDTYKDRVLSFYSQYKCTNVGNYQNKIINAAKSYLNKGIAYSQEQPHCGPSAIGYTSAIDTLDCSGYVSRVYKDVGLVPVNYCQNTLGITHDSTNFIRIASNITEGKNSAQVGDIIIYGQRLPNGNFDKNDHSHAAIYAGNENIYEMTRGKNVPRLTTGRAWDYGKSNPVYGVYRAKKFPLETDATPANGKTIVIDPGHGTKNSRSGETGEAEFNLSISKKIKSKLEQNGFKVYLTHNQSNKSENLGSDYEADNQKRAEISNSKNPFLIVSIHADQPAGGAAVYYPPLDKKPDIAPHATVINNIGHNGKFEAIVAGA